MQEAENIKSIENRLKYIEDFLFDPNKGLIVQNLQSIKKIEEQIESLQETLESKTLDIHEKIERAVTILAKLRDLMQEMSQGGKVQIIA